MPESSNQAPLPPSPAQPATDSHYIRGGNRAFHNYYNDYSHIADANLRRRLALSDVDKVPFGTCRMYTIKITTRCLCDVDSDCCNRCNGCLHKGSTKKLT